jgi:hypothetical protein
LHQEIRALIVKPITTRGHVRVLDAIGAVAIRHVIAKGKPAFVHFVLVQEKGSLVISILDLAHHPIQAVH